MRSGDEVSIIEPAEGARIVIPVAVEGSYDLKTEFVRDEGSKDIGTTIPVGSHACQIMLGAGRIRGLDTVSSKRSGEDDNPSKVISDRFQNGHVYGLLAKIRLLDAGKASVNVVVDGKPSIHWEGHPAASRLPAIGRCPRPTTLASEHGGPKQLSNPHGCGWFPATRRWTPRSRNRWPRKKPCLPRRRFR